MKETLTTIEEIRKKIRYLSLVTRKSMQHILLGENKSRTLGQGLSFDQTREYQYGDDVRHIDWKAYARTQMLSTKQYTEEKKKKVFVLCDISYSTSIDTALQSKYEVCAQAAAVIMLAASFNKDYVSSILYSDEVLDISMPTNKTSEVSVVLQKILSFQYPETQNTSIYKAVEKLISVQKKNAAVVIIISDFIDKTITDALRIVSNYYNVFGIRVLDPIEMRLPAIGFLRLLDIENKRELLISSKNEKAIQALLAKRVEEQNKMFKRFNIPTLDLFSDNPSITDSVVRFLLKMERVR